LILALTADTRGMLDGLVAELRTRQADIAGTGRHRSHTDSVGTDAYNRALSLPCGVGAVLD
jgi:outer membrane protein OmpA-like peptidoglycan-associated protein